VIRTVIRRYHLSCIDDLHAMLTDDHTLNGDRLGGGSIDFIGRGTIEGNIGGTISDPANMVVHVKLELYGGGGRKHRSFQASEIGSC
jgi:hypothetical protein